MASSWLKAKRKFSPWSKYALGLRVRGGDLPGVLAEAVEERDLLGRR